MPAQNWHRNERLPSLDGFRAISVLLVMTNHLFRSMNMEIDDHAGDLGVRCFFVISGFLITYLFLKEEAATGAISLHLFYARRALRIVPVYIAFIGFLFLLSYTSRAHFTPCQWLTSLTFTKDFGCRSWNDAHLWSLSVEEQFYLLWPLVLAGCNPRSRMMIAFGLICVCPAARIVYHFSSFPLEAAYSPLTNADMLMYGCLAAMLLNGYASGFLRVLGIAPALGRFFAFCLILIPIMLERNFVAGFLTVPFASSVEALALAYLICSYALVRSGLGFWLLNSASARFVGVISYSLYIWHLPFFNSLNNYVDTNLSLFVFPINVVSVFVVATVSYFGLERPLTSLRYRLRADKVAPADGRRPFGFSS
jgi:peptidoglycan/LPS O-acetylase OafA/YrhL